MQRSHESKVAARSRRARACELAEKIPQSGDRSSQEPSPAGKTAESGDKNTLRPSRSHHLRSTASLRRPCDRGYASKSRATNALR
eukprot:4159595-Alexandrium_andersonii.AAC.1